VHFIFNNFDDILCQTHIWVSEKLAFLARKLLLRIFKRVWWGGGYERIWVRARAYRRASRFSMRFTSQDLTGHFPVRGEAPCTTLYTNFVISYKDLFNHNMNFQFSNNNYLLMNIFLFETL